MNSIDEQFVSAYVDIKIWIYSIFYNPRGIDMIFDIIKKLTVCVLSIVLILCFVSCSQINNGDTPNIPSETKNEEPKETERAEETTAPDANALPIIEAPEININEIVWSKSPMSKSTSKWLPGNYEMAILERDDTLVGEVADEKWYCVEIVNHNPYLNELVVKSKDNWPEGIDADGKLTTLINDYNAKYAACMEYLKGRTADEINKALSDDAYLALRNSAKKAWDDFNDYCNDFFKNIEKQIKARADSATSYKESLQASYDLENHKNSVKKFWDDIDNDSNFNERLKLLGLFEYRFSTSAIGSHYVAKGEDLKALPDRVQAIDGFGIYWSVNHDSGEWN